MRIKSNLHVAFSRRLVCSDIAFPQPEPFRLSMPSELAIERWHGFPETIGIKMMVSASRL